MADLEERRMLSRWSISGTAETHQSRFPARSALEVTAEERTRVYEQEWERGGPPSLLFSFNDIGVDADANATAADFVRERIREKVNDASVAELLLPYDYPIGTKRICFDIDYYETYNRDNVTLVDVRENPIEEITRHGVRTTMQEYELDILVFAIGFDAMTGALLDMDIRGRDGLALTEKWSAGPRTYLGLSTVGFPNLFTVTGPGSPSVLTNMVITIEQHVEWIADCLSYLEKNGLRSIEPEVVAENEWVDHVNELAARTLHSQANSWYLGANIPGKPRVFMPYVGGLGTYREICQQVADNGYEGFAVDSEIQSHA
jgi:cyclohexanone monooxygenase